MNYSPNSGAEVSAGRLLGTCRQYRLRVIVERHKSRAPRLFSPESERHPLDRAAEPEKRGRRPSPQPQSERGTTRCLRDRRFPRSATAIREVMTATTADVDTSTRCQGRNKKTSGPNPRPHETPRRTRASPSGARSGKKITQSRQPPAGRAIVLLR